MIDELLGQKVGRWQIDSYLGCGKSALVMSAIDSRGVRAAVKIFDPELIERLGKPMQLARIARECALAEGGHPHLVRIYDGGECVSTGRLYVAMELIDAPNLGSVLSSVPRERIAPIVKQIASAAHFLESKELAHRDIKPDNIAISKDYLKATLLDLGVLRPFGSAGLTDEDARVFIGTLRYSSPEFLLREEVDSIEGWRAITFYQLGAVLHDMIMRRPLFEEYSDPYAMLVEAVKSTKPTLRADDVSPDLIALAQNCLIKKSDARNKLVSWADFELMTEVHDAVTAARERVRKRALVAQLAPGIQANIPSLEYRQMRELITNRIESIIRGECVASASFPPLELQADQESESVCVRFRQSEEHGLSIKTTILFTFTIIDRASIAFSLSGAIGITEVQVPPVAPIPKLEIFRGQLDSQLCPQKIQDFLYEAVDRVQQLAQPVPSGGRWLEVTQ